MEFTHRKFWAGKEDNGFGPPPPVSQQSPGFPCFSHWSYCPRFWAECLSRQVPLGAIPPFSYPGIRNWMKEDPASTLEIHTRLCGKRQWKRKLGKHPHWGGQREASPGYAIPRPAVGQLVGDQRVSRFGCAFSGQPMLTGTFLGPRCGHSRFSLSLRATAGRRMASWLQCVLVSFSSAKENGAEHVLGTR